VQLRSHQRTRRLAIFLAGLTLVVPLLSIVHLSAVVHALCNEHGELVEVRGTLSPTQETLDGITRLRTQPLLGADVHEHCSIGVHSRTPRVSPSAPWVVAHSCEPLKPFAEFRALLPRSEIPLLLLAPKNSPPV